MVTHTRHTAFTRNKLQAEQTDRVVGNPLHRLWALYALLSVFAVFFPHRPATWPIVALIHAFIIALYWPLPPFKQGWDIIARSWPRTMRIIFDWLPLLLVPVLYTELAPLNLMVHAGHYFDSLIIAVERATVGMPSRDLAANFPILWLSEILHAGYLSYYFIIFIPPCILYVARKTEAYRRVVFTVLLSFFMHYLFFIYFPVQGPRYLFPAPGGRGRGVPMVGTMWEWVMPWAATSRRVSSGDHRSMSTTPTPRIVWKAASTPGINNQADTRAALGIRYATCCTPSP